MIALPPAAAVARRIERHPAVVQAWFRGERWPKLDGISAILEAYPHLGARWLVNEFIRRKKAWQARQ